MSDNTHAIENARTWFHSIREMVKEAEEVDQDTDARYEAAREYIEESVLSVQVRSGWHLPSAHSIPVEYEILLTIGGPDLRIIGYLDGYCEPENAVMQWREWGTSWTDATPSLEPFTPSDINAILLSFARHFYFGG